MTNDNSEYLSETELEAELNEQERDLDGFDLYDLSETDGTTYEDLQAHAEWLAMWDELDSSDFVDCE